MRNHINHYEWVYPYSDLCIAFNTFGSKQMILGGGDKVIKSSYYQDYTKSFNRFWECLGNGSTADAALYELDLIAVHTYDVKMHWRARGNFMYSLGVIRLSNTEW